MGVVLWTKTGKGRRIDKIAGSPAGNGYLYVCIHGSKYPVHRLAWFLVNNEWPEEIDHIDGNPLNNKIANLRKATRSQNMMNRRVVGNSKTGISGVSFSNTRKKWVAHIGINGKLRFLGYFTDIRKAAEARLCAERDLFGVFSKNHTQSL